MSSPSYAMIMLLAGIGIPVLAALNGGLGRHLSSPVAASLVLFAVGLAVTLPLLAWFGPEALARVADAPRHLLLGGVLVAFYVVSITTIAPRFGVGNAVFFVLLGQLISAAIIDQYGLFGAPPAPVTWERALGIALMAAGVALTQRG